MRLLDRYIVREYLRAVVGVAFILTVLMLVAIILEHIDDVVEHSASAGTSLEWFVMMLPERMVQVVPFIVLLGVMFSIGNLSRHNEIIAIVSTGVSRARLFVPVLGLTAAITVCTLLFNEVVVPAATRRGEHVERVNIEGKPPQTEAGETFIRGAGDTYYWMERYLDHAYRPRMVRPSILRLSADRTHIAERVDAQTAVFIRQRAEGRDQYWLFFHGTRRVFDPAGEQVEIEAFRERRFDLEDDLRQFLSVQKEPWEMNFLELRRHIGVLSARPDIDLDEMRTEMHLKLAFPLSLLIIALLAYPFAMKTRSGSLFIGFSLAIVWIIAFYAFLAVLRGLGHEGHLWPWFAAWSPTAVFSVIALYFAGLWRT